MIFNPSQWADLGKLLDIMQQLFDMPKDSMHLDVTDAGISIKGKSLDSEVTLTIKSKKPQN